MVFKTDKISQQPENCEKKWWIESDFKAPNLPLSLRLNIKSLYED
jgi:hypothetical protein